MALNSMDEPFVIICSSCNTRNPLSADVCSKCGTDLLTGRVVDASVADTQAIPTRGSAPTEAPVDPAGTIPPLSHGEHSEDIRRRLTRTFSKTRMLESAISSALDKGMANLESEPLLPALEGANEGELISRVTERINNYFKSEKIRELITSICVSMTRPLQDQFSELIRTEVVGRLDEHVARAIERHATAGGGKLDAAMVRGVVREVIDEEQVLRSVDALDFVQQETVGNIVEKEISTKIEGVVRKSVTKASVDEGALREIVKEMIESGDGKGAGRIDEKDIARKTEVELRLQAEIRRLEEKLARQPKGSARLDRADVENLVHEIMASNVAGWEGEAGTDMPTQSIARPSNFTEEIQRSLLDMHASQEVWQLIERKIREVGLDLYHELMEGVHDFLLDKVNSYTQGFSAQTGEVIRSEIASRLPGVLQSYLNTDQFLARLRHLILAQKADIAGMDEAALRKSMLGELSNALGSDLFKEQIQEALKSLGSDDMVKAVIESPKFPLYLKKSVQNEVAQFSSGAPADAESVRGIVDAKLGELASDQKFVDRLSGQLLDLITARIDEQNQDLVNVIVGKVEELLPDYLNGQFSSENFQSYFAGLIANSPEMQGRFEKVVKSFLDENLGQIVREKLESQSDQDKPGASDSLNKSDSDFFSHTDTVASD